MYRRQLLLTRVQSSHKLSPSLSCSTRSQPSCVICSSRSPRTSTPKSTLTRPNRRTLSREFGHVNSSSSLCRFSLAVSASRNLGPGRPQALPRQSLERYASGSSELSLRAAGSFKHSTSQCHDSRGSNRLQTQPDPVHPILNHVTLRGSPHHNGLELPHPGRWARIGSSTVAPCPRTGLHSSCRLLHIQSRRSRLPGCLPSTYLGSYPCPSNSSMCVT